jgi:CBS domain-containing protein
MSDAASELARVVKKLDSSDPPAVTVREFLHWFGYERRGSRVVAQIRRVLEKCDLRTTPDFEFHWIDGYIGFTRTTKSTGDAGNVENREERKTEVTVVGGAVEDPTHNIGKLDAANTPPIRVRPDDSINHAVTIMLRENFSQLPVMTSERDVSGAISWRTIGSRIAFGKKCHKVSDCMDKKIEIVAKDVSLFRVIDLIAIKDFVLVRDTDRRISGIITTADLGESFHQLARPFLLLSEIEHHLRWIIDGRFTADELKRARNSDDPDREVSTVSDLTFGEYVHLLQNKEKWKKVGLEIDRVEFVKSLERVNAIRNDVMHFDPDGLGEDDLAHLKKMASFIQELREIGRA